LLIEKVVTSACERKTFKMSNGIYIEYASKTDFFEGELDHVCYIHELQESRGGGVLHFLLFRLPAVSFIE
jgi:hypothetical protein